MIIFIVMKKVEIWISRQCPHALFHVVDVALIGRGSAFVVAKNNLLSVIDIQLGRIGKFFHSLVFYSKIQETII